MAILIGMPRAVWKRQPQGQIDIDLNNPLTKNLKKAFVFNGIKSNIVNRNEVYDHVFGAFTGLGTERALYITGSNNFTAASIDSIGVGYNSFSIATSWFFLSITDILGKWNAYSIPGTSQQILLRNNTASFFVKDYADINTATATGPFTIPTGVTVSLCCSATGGSIFSGVNGVYGAGASLSGPYIPPNTDKFSLVGRAHNQIASTGYCRYFYFWDSFLTEAMSKEIHINPWQIFKPRIARFISIPSTGTVTFKPYWARSRSLIIGSGV